MRGARNRLGFVLVLGLAAPQLATAAPAASAAARQAALELVDVLGVEAAVTSGLQAGVEADLAAGPEMAPYADVVREFARRYVTWQAARPRLASLYAARFTEDELRELLAFYRTPLGQKARQVTPEILAQAPALAREMAGERRAELQAMLQARRLELARQSPSRRRTVKAADPGEVILGLAASKLDNRRWEEGRDLLVRFLEMRPDSPDALSDLGLCYRELGQPRLALETFEKARALAPDHWRARYNIVLVQAFDLGEPAAAEAALRELEALQPGNVEVAKLRAAVDRRRGGP